MRDAGSDIAHFQEASSTPLLALACGRPGTWKRCHQHCPVYRPAYRPWEATGFSSALPRPSSEINYTERVKSRLGFIPHRVAFATGS